MSSDAALACQRHKKSGRSTRASISPMSAPRPSSPYASDDGSQMSHTSPARAHTMSVPRHGVPHLHWDDALHREDMAAVSLQAVRSSALTFIHAEESLSPTLNHS